MFKELLQTAVVSAPANKWPTYDGKELDRSDFLTSSEVASCLRKSFFGKTVTSPYRTNGYAERGHAIEAWVVGKLKHLGEGYTFEYMGKDQRSFYDPGAGLAGTPDGLLTLPDGKKWLLEIKSIDPRTNKNNLPKKNHIYQVQQNMYLVQGCLKIKLEGALLLYIDASNVFDVLEFIIKYDDTIVEECLNRAVALWNASKPDQVEPEGIYNGECDMCDFTSQCSATVGMTKKLLEAGAAAGPFLDDADEANLPSGGVREVMRHYELTNGELVTVIDWLSARELMKTEEKAKEYLDDKVKKIVMDHGGLVIAGKYTLTAKEMPGKATVDQKAMEAAGLVVADFKKVGKPFVQINVKKQGDESEVREST